MVNMNGEPRTETNWPATKVVRVEDAARQLGVGRTIVFGLIRSGALRSIKIGSRRLVPMTAIDEFIKQQSNDANDREETRPAVLDIGTQQRGKGK